MVNLLDSHGRNIDYIRISLTDRCNFRCVYCMPEQGESFIPHQEILTYEELLRLCKIFAFLGVKYYKITGGEPLCRKGAIGFIKNLRAIKGIKETTLTTNGSLLEKYAEQLAELGVEAINISLDAMSQDIFSRLSRSDVKVQDVLRGMEKAKSLGLRIKINTVPVAGQNERELVPLTEYAIKNGFAIRFIELMPVGEGNALQGIPLIDVRQKIETHFGELKKINSKMGNGPALCYDVSGGIVGFIGALTEKFCSTCNRIRLTSSGYLKTCLHHNVGVDLKPLLRTGATNEQITEVILEAVAKKPKAHSFAFLKNKSAKEELLMHSIGG